MLRKFIKHEFIATARIMWIFYAAMAALSVGANLSFRFYERFDLPAVNALMTLTIIVWVMSLIACMVGTLVLAVRRFHQNLLTDEGYLMFTLPGNVHHLVISKLLVSCVWFLASMLAIFLAVGIAVLDSEVLREITIGWRELMEQITAFYAFNGTAVILEALVVFFVGCAAYMLQFYSAMAIGYGFNSRKGLLSVVFYFVQGYVIQMIGTVLMFGGIQLLPDRFLEFADLSPMQAFHLTMLAVLVSEVILGAVFYGITVLNLQKRLNLS